MSALLDEHLEGARLTLTLSRPEIHNALNDELIDALAEAVEGAASREGARYVVIAGEGRSFCAGADLGWMKAMVGASREENMADARRLVRLLEAMVGCPLPVIARVHGATLGGGMGLVAACDLIVAHPRARFGLTEVRLGLAPAMIFPYLLRRVDGSRLVEAALTGERFGADEAQAMGLINAVDEELDAVIARWGQSICASAKGGVAAAKRLFVCLPRLPADEQVAFTTKMIADLRAGAEGQEGMRAFLEKREPSWRARHEESGT